MSRKKIYLSNTENELKVYIIEAPESSKLEGLTNAISVVNITFQNIDKLKMSTKVLFITSVICFAVMFLVTLKVFS